MVINENQIMILNSKSWAVILRLSLTLDFTATIISVFLMLDANLTTTEQRFYFLRLECDDFVSIIRMNIYFDVITKSCHHLD